MNIFVLDRDVLRCAAYHNDRHVVKMITELNQMLCTCIILAGGEAPYRKTHSHHPCTRWARESLQHWLYVKELTLALCHEYTHRYGKIHKGESIVRSLTLPDLPDLPWKDPPQVMPDECKDSDVVTAYRRYYCLKKQHIANWTHRKVPEWFVLADL